MVELEKYRGKISHKKGQYDDDIELSEYDAIKLDNEDGISVALGFVNSSISKADFLHVDNDLFVIIEASDLKNQINDCFQNIQVQKEKELAKLNQNGAYTTRLKKREIDKIEKRCYLPLKAELMQKWCGSIAVCERLCRLNKLDIMPRYKYLLVCKNDTDIQVLDRFKIRVSGFIKDIKIVTTRTIKLDF